MRIPVLVCLATVTAAAGPARAERLLGISHSRQIIFKIDTETGELITFPGHPILHLGGLDIDSAGNLYYLAQNTLWRIDLLQPGGDQFVGSVPDEIFESFEIIDDVGYTGGVFSGTFYAIDLATGAATALGQYGDGGFDRFTGLASTDAPGSRETLQLYAGRVFLSDVIRVDPATGQNLGVVVEDEALSTTNLAWASSAFWFIDQLTLYRIDLTLDGGIAVPVLEDLDIGGCDGLTAVHPEPSIVTASLRDGVLGERYGPLVLEHAGGGPGIQWVALTAGYDEIDLGESQFTPLIGIPQGLSGDDVAMTYPMPFPFPYYGESYTEVHVCNNGFIDLDAPFTDPDNSDEAMIASRRICPMWDDLRTDFGGRDLHIDASVPDQVTFRWDTLQFPTFGVCNFSCTLHACGAIQFDYGVIGAAVTPTVGVSAGDGPQFIVSRYSGRSDLHSADSLRFEPGGGLPPGLVLATDGTIDGTPLESGSYPLTVRLTDALGGFDERALTLEVLEEAACAADVSGPVAGEPDGTVSVSDLVYVIGQWGPGGAADFTGPRDVPDGVVDVLELVAVITAWGGC